MILHMFTCISVLKEYQYDYTVNARAFQDFKIKKSATKLNITLYSYRSKGLQHYTRVKRVHYTHTARSVHAVSTHLTGKYIKMRGITRM